MPRDPAEVIDAIEAARARNNRNWMDLLRLAYLHAPEEAAAIVREIHSQDGAISALVEELAPRTTAKFASNGVGDLICTDSGTS